MKLKRLQKNNGFPLRGYLVYFFLITLSATAFGQTSGNSIDGGYLREWLILGPFPHSNSDHDYLKQASGEANVHPKAGDTFITSSGDTLSWIRYYQEGVETDFRQALGDHTYATAYAFAVLNSPRESEGHIDLSSDDGASLYVNGELLYRNLEINSNSDDKAIIASKFHKGANLLMVKVTQGLGNWRLALRATKKPQYLVRGKISDHTGAAVPKAVIQIMEGNNLVASAKTDENGAYQVKFLPYTNKYTLIATTIDYTVEEKTFIIQRPRSQIVNLKLPPQQFVSGSVYMLDGETPQVGVPVELVKTEPGGKETRVKTGLTNLFGQFELIVSKPGKYRVRCQTPYGQIYYRTKGNTGKEKAVIDLGRAEKLNGIDFEIARIHRGTWQHYTALDGLPHHRINAIHRSSDGTVWLGTELGISHFDGLRFRNYQLMDGLANNNVRCIAAAEEESLWIGTFDGISHFDGQTFTNYNKNHGLLDSHINDILVNEDGSLWIATENGPAFFENGRFSVVPELKPIGPHFVNHIFRSSDNALWFATQKGAWKYHNGNLVSILGDAVDAMRVYEDTKGCIWIGTKSGIARFKNEEITWLTTLDGLAHDHVTDIKQTADGTHWITTENGLSRLDENGFTNYIRKTREESDILRSLELSDSGMLIIGGWSGLSLFEPSTFDSFDKTDGLSHWQSPQRSRAIFDIHFDADSVLWLASEWAGIFQVRDNRLKKMYPLSKELYVREIYQTRDKRLWFGASSGLILYENDEFTKLNSSGWVMTIAEDDSSWLWLGNGWAGGGLTHYNPAVPKNSRTLGSADGLPSDNVNDIKIDKNGILWIATNAGIATYSQGHFRNRCREWGVKEAGYHTIHIDRDGGYWFGGQSGILSYNAASGELLQLNENGLFEIKAGKSFQKSALLALPSSNIWSIFQAGDGTMWFGSESRGIIGYDGIATTVLDSRDGLAGNSVMNIEGDANDNLWIGFLDNGLSFYRVSAEQPSINLQSVEIDGQPIDARGSFEMIRNASLQFSYEERDFYTNPAKRKFLVRILSDEAEIVLEELTQARTYTWTAEEAGDYKISVQAVSRDLNYSEPAILQFKVSPRWLDNPLIIGPLITALILLIVSTLYSRYQSYHERLEAQRLRDEMLVQEREAREKEEAARVELEIANLQLADAKNAAEVANQSKSTFLSQMTHELRTPMNGVLGMATLLGETRLNKAQKDLLQTLRASGDTLLTIINDILDFSKIEANKLELEKMPFSIEQSIQDTFDIVRYRASVKKLELKYEIAQNVPDAICQDATRLRQILTNLVGNAIKFTESGGITVSVEASPLEDKPDIYTLHFAVEDTGIGIPKDRLNRLFRSFSQVDESTTRKYGGTGLGLAISKQLAELMNGRMWVESEFGKGSTFNFTIIAAKAKIAAESRSKGKSGLDPEMAERKPLRILLAEDNVVNQKVAVGILKKCGYKADVAANGLEALQAQERIKYDVILMDIHMPEMDGVAATQRIREEIPRSEQPTIIALTADAMEQHKQQYLEAGMDDFVSKPIRVNELLAALERVKP